MSRYTVAPLAALALAACGPTAPPAGEPAVVEPPPVAVAARGTAAPRPVETELWLLPERLRASVPGRLLGSRASPDDELGGAVPVHGTTEHRFEAFCGELVVTASEALARAPTDLLAAVRARESSDGRVVRVEAMPEAPPPPRVVRALRHEDVERPSRFHGAVLVVELPEHGVVELGLECDRRSGSASEWDAWTRPLVRSLLPGSRAPELGGGEREVGLGPVRLTWTVPQGWALAGSGDDAGEVGVELVRVGVYGQEAPVVSVVVAPECPRAEGLEGEADAGSLDAGPPRARPGTVAGRAVRWRVVRELELDHREQHGGSCVTWTVAAPDAAGLEAALSEVARARLAAGSGSAGEGP